MASYPEFVQERLADFRTGIPARCKFLPTIAEIVDLGDEILRNEIASRPKPKLVEIHQSPEERKRVGERLKALAAELACAKIIEKAPILKPISTPVKTLSESQKAELIRVKKIMAGEQ